MATVGDALSRASNIRRRATSSANSRAAAKSQQAEKIGSENRTAIRGMLAAALKQGNSNQINSLAPEAAKVGVDVAPYLTAVQNLTPEQSLSNEINQLVSNAMKGQGGEGNVDWQKGEAGPQPSGSSNEADSLFTPEFLYRAGIKQATGIDIGEHPLTDPQWLNDFATMSKNNPDLPAREVIMNVGQKYGRIPSFVQHLKDIDIETRKELADASILRNFNDPELVDYSNEYAKRNPGVDPEKTRLMIILSDQLDQGGVLPDKYQALFERWSGLQAELREMEESDILFEEGTRDRAKEINFLRRGGGLDRNLTTQEALGTEKFQRETREAGIPQPISQEDKAKYGVDPKQFPTYESVAASGRRFPSASDQTIYQSVSGVREKLTQLEDIMFGPDGVFKGIGKDWLSRKTGQAKLVAESLKGSQRGINYEIYSDLTGSIARILIELSGSGERPTDKDVEMMYKEAATVGGLFEAIESEAGAKQKYERLMVLLNKTLDRIHSTTTIPEPEVTYEINEVAEDAEGNQATYKGKDANGEDIWEPLSQ